jgi:hypothetical protein
VNPRPPPFVRVRNRTRCPDMSSMPSSPCDRDTRLTNRSSSGAPSISVSSRRNASSDVSNWCAEWMISRSPSRNSPASSRASNTEPLPFCLGTIMPTSNAAHDPSARSPSACSSTNACHGSSVSPAIAASSHASRPVVDEYSGTQHTRGSWAPIMPSPAAASA